jgi:hypothetical protein
MKTLCAGIAVILVMLGCGGRKSPTALIARALSSTNVVFQTDRQEPITLSVRRAEMVTRAVRIFEDPSRVEIRKEILPAYTGRFVFGDVSFGWVGSLLCLKGSDGQEYFVVQDAALGKMSELYFKKLGPPPTHELSGDEWQEVLAELENKK